MSEARDVYIVDGVRAPQAKAGSKLETTPLPFLATPLVKALADRHQLPNDCIDEMIMGNTGAPAKYPNISRIIALEAGLDKGTSAYTVHRNCASGMEAVSQAYDKIKLKRADLVFAGGIESMSQFPLIYSKEMTNLFMNLMKAKTVSEKLKALMQFRPSFLAPIIAIQQGLTDPVCGLNMGQTAEILAREFNITREEQDAFAVRSHQLYFKAKEEGKWADELVPIAIGTKLDKILDEDFGPRPDLSVEKMKKLKPYFDRKSGTVTVGNSCPITDGASMLILCSEEALKKYNLSPMAKLIDYKFSALEPERMGLGPALAMTHLMENTNTKLQDVDLIEINEAFAAQVLSVIKVCKDSSLASKWNLNPIGEISDEILNVNGGGIALGHPVGSSGSRIIVTLIHELKRRNKKRGVASLCIGGGQGGAVLVENLS